MTNSHSGNLYLEANSRDDLRPSQELPLETWRMPTLILTQGREPASGNSRMLVQVPHEQPPVPEDHWLQDEERTYPLKVGVNMIGRLPDNDVVIQEPHVSRRQCIIVIGAGAACELHDNGSRNGTFVNGLKATGPTKLVSGQVIWICDHRFVFLSKRGRDN